MASKTIQISARISDQDADFINGLKIEGAKTPSDKLRTIISEARQRQAGLHDYKECYKQIQHILLPIVEKVRHLELDHQVHSEFVIRFFEWLPDIMAYAVSSIPGTETENIPHLLKHYEKELLQRVLRLFCSVLQMGVTSQSPCYDPELITKEITAVLDLARIIDSNKTSTLK